MKRGLKTRVTTITAVLIVLGIALPAWVLLITANINNLRTLNCLTTFRCAPVPGYRHDYFLPLGYKTNPLNYSNDIVSDMRIYQPDVYNYAAHFATRRSNTWLIDVGCGSGINAAQIYDSDLAFVEIDFGNNINLSKANFRRTVRFEQTKGNGVIWHDWDVSSGSFPHLDASVLRGATIVASDIIEHLLDPDLLVDSLLALLEGCGAETLVLSTRNRLPKDGNGPAWNIHHVREWTIRELAAYLTSRVASVQECILTNTRVGITNLGTSTCLVSKRPKRFPDMSLVHDYFRAPTFENISISMILEDWCRNSWLTQSWNSFSLIWWQGVQYCPLPTLIMCTKMHQANQSLKFTYNILRYAWWYTCMVMCSWSAQHAVVVGTSKEGYLINLS